MSSQPIRCSPQLLQSKLTSTISLSTYSAKLENCILAAGSTVDEKCNLKDCDVAASVKVPSGTNSKGEKFDE